jgi:hypothetical protein
VNRSALQINHLPSTLRWQRVLGAQFVERQNVADTSENSMSASVYVCFLRIPKGRMIRAAAP